MSQNAKVFYLKKSQVFAEFSDSQVKELAKLLHDKTLKECELVFAAEDKDKIFFVKKGAVDINKITRDGRKITVDTLNAGSFFGSVGKGLPEDYYVEASEDAYICVADKDKLYAMLEKYPKFALRMVEGLFIDLCHKKRSKNQSEQPSGAQNNS